MLPNQGANHVDHPVGEQFNDLAGQELIGSYTGLCGETMADESSVRPDGPNILMVMSDQHRGDWLGCAGADWLRTPNIDRLAERGVHFRNAACNSPLCAPSRASLASGLRCSNVGVLLNSHLYPLETPTYYQALRRAGYRVGCVGKTDLHKRDHWEGRNGDRPIMYHLGFTDPMETEGKCSASRYATKGVCPYTNYLKEKGLAKRFDDDYNRTRSSAWYSADSVLPLEAYHDYFVGIKGCEFLENVDDESPWHYFVSYVGPHNPWDAPHEYSRRFDPKDMPVEKAIEDDCSGKPEFVRNRHEKASRGLTAERLAGAWQQYSAMINLIDDFMGRFVEILKDRGMLENTVIIYCSDHGEMMGDHGMFYKSVFYEGALRVPLVMAGPGIKAQGTSDALVELADMAPTILELAGVPPEFPMDARSAVPVLKGEEPKFRQRQISEVGCSKMLFDGRYKYTDNSRDLDELYDLENDPQELDNLARTRKDKAYELSRELHGALRAP